MEDSASDNHNDGLAFRGDVHHVEDQTEQNEVCVGVTVSRERILSLIRENEESKFKNQEFKNTLEKVNREKKALELKLVESEARTQELLYERSEIACSESLITDLRNEIEELLIQISSMQQDFSMKFLDFKTSENHNKHLIAQLQESAHKYRAYSLKLVSVLNSKGQIDNADPAIAKVLAESKDTDWFRAQNLKLQNELEFYKNSAKENQVRVANLQSRLLEKNARLVQINSLLKQSARLRSFEKQMDTNRSISSTVEAVCRSEDLPKRNSYLSSTSYGYHSAADSGEVRSHERLSQDLHHLYERNGYEFSSNVNEEYGYLSREQVQHHSVSGRSNTSSNNSVSTMIPSPHSEYQASIDQIIRRRNIRM